LYKQHLENLRWKGSLKSCFCEAISQVIAQMGSEVIRDYETLVLLAKKG